MSGPRGGKPRPKGLAYLTADMNQSVEVRLAQRYPGSRMAPFAYRVRPDGTVERIQEPAA